MRAICARRRENWTWVNGSSRFSGTSSTGTRPGTRPPLVRPPGTATYHAGLVLEPADYEAGRELSSRLEDVAHSKHNGAGAQSLVLTAGPRRVPPRWRSPG